MYFIGEGLLGVWVLQELDAGEGSTGAQPGNAPKRSQQLMMMGAAAVREVLGVTEREEDAPNLKRTTKMRRCNTGDPSIYLKIGELQVGGQSPLPPLSFLLNPPTPKLAAVSTQMAADWGVHSCYSC